LLNHSIIVPFYSDNIIQPEQQNVIDQDDPDLDLNGAEVSRYTFFEYLRFLVYDIKSNNSQYVNTLNRKMKQKYSVLVDKLEASGPSYGELEGITLQKLETALEQFSLEYKGKNWALWYREDIPYANNTLLWQKVDQTWQ
jgi:hypothetical protein